MAKITTLSDRQDDVLGGQERVEVVEVGAAALVGHGDDGDLRWPSRRRTGRAGTAGTTAVRAAIIRVVTR